MDGTTGGWVDRICQGDSFVKGVSIKEGESLGEMEINDGGGGGGA